MVVAIMKILVRILAIHGTLIPENCQLSKNHLNSAKLHQIGLNKPDKDASKGLIVKKKNIRVLLDTGSSGDLHFIRKGPRNTYHA